MKLTKLRQIIKEEIHKVLNEEVKGNIKVGESYYFGDLNGAFTALLVKKVDDKHVYFEYEMDGAKGKMLIDNFKKKATKNPSSSKSEKNKPNLKSMDFDTFFKHNFGK